MAEISNYISTSVNTRTGMSPIYVTFYLQNQKVTIPTKVSTKREWFIDGKVCRKDKDWKDKNLIIDQIRGHVSNIFTKYRLREKVLTKTMFMQQWTRPTGYDTFYDFADWFMMNHTKELELGTIKNHKTSLKKLKEFDPGLTFDSFTEQKLKDFRAHLLRDVGNNKATVNKNLGCIKKYAMAAVKMKLMDENPFEGIKISRGYEDAAEYLTQEELQVLCTLYKMHTLSATKQKCLLFFLFMCFSSMHIGDAKAFTLEQVADKHISYVRKKTKNSKGQLIFIPLSESLRFVIGEAAGFRCYGTLFEGLPADQKINEYLKKIAKFAGISKKISCKSGRHTFATLFLKHTRDLNTLKKLMGHSSYQETLRYAHVLDEDKYEGIKCFDRYM